MNLYAYVGNDPINMIDPTGMFTCEQSTADYCIEFDIFNEKGSESQEKENVDIEISQTALFKGEEYTQSTELSGQSITLTEEQIMNAEVINGVEIAKIGNEFYLIAGDVGIIVSSIELNFSTVKNTSSGTLQEGEAIMSYKLRIGHYSKSGKTPIFNLKSRINKSCGNSCWGGY